MVKTRDFCVYEMVCFTEVQIVLMRNMLAEMKPQSTSRWDLLAMVMCDLRDHWDTSWRDDLLSLYYAIKRMPAHELHRVTAMLM